MLHFPLEEPHISPIKIIKILKKNTGCDSQHLSHIETARMSKASRFNKLRLIKISHFISFRWTLFNRHLWYGVVVHIFIGFPSGSYLLKDTNADPSLMDLQVKASFPPRSRTSHDQEAKPLGAFWVHHHLKIPPTASSLSNPLTPNRVLGDSFFSYYRFVRSKRRHLHRVQGDDFSWLPICFSGPRSRCGSKWMPFGDEKAVLRYSVLKSFGDVH